LNDLAMVFRCRFACPLLLLAVAVCAACMDSSNGGAARATGNVVDVAVSTGSISAPDSTASGWRTVRVAEDSGSHIVVLFRLPADWSEAELATLLTDIDTGSVTPAPAVALGGPEIGNSGEVILNVQPGVYVLACVTRDSEGHRHAVRGEARVLVAHDPSVNAAEPVATDSIDMSDFAFLRGETWKSGNHLIRIANHGMQDHQLRIARVRDGFTAQQVLTAEDPATLLTGVAGMARMGPGQVAYLPIDLTPGLYLFTCLVRDPKSGKAHAELGMFRPVQVE
jgi:hypothetical protein